MTKSEAHRTSFTPTDAYVAICWNCDWEGPLRRDPVDAKRDAREHGDLAADQPGH